MTGIDIFLLFTTNTDIMNDKHEHSDEINIPIICRRENYVSVHAIDITIEETER